jgi:hypothetical protein
MGVKKKRQRLIWRQQLRQLVGQVAGEAGQEDEAAHLSLSLSRPIAAPFYRSSTFIIVGSS